MASVYHLDKPRNFHPELLFVVTTGAQEGMGVGEGEDGLRTRMGQEEEGCGALFGEIFRNRISFTTRQWAGAESLQDSPVAGDSMIFHGSENVL